MHERRRKTMWVTFGWYRAETGFAGHQPGGSIWRIGLRNPKGAETRRRRALIVQTYQLVRRRHLFDWQRDVLLAASQRQQRLARLSWLASENSAPAAPFKNAAVDFSPTVVSAEGRASEPSFVRVASDASARTSPYFSFISHYQQRTSL
jgi:hypothetical protein